jgi:hypothetical protein
MSTGQTDIFTSFLHKAITHEELVLGLPDGVPSLFSAVLLSDPASNAHVQFKACFLEFFTYPVGRASLSDAAVLWAFANALQSPDAAKRAYFTGM